MRNQLSHTAGIHTIAFRPLCGSYKIALYTVLLSAVDGEILLLPVHVRHVEMRQYGCRHYTYSSAEKNVQV